ncbi:MAG: hypothetical protein SNJ56_04675 [Termitinemataceae bacterium]
MQTYASFAISSIPVSSYAWNAGYGSKLVLPVAPSSYIYSHFKHVSGFPAAEGQQGVPITKLKILDTLIEQLAELKKRPASQRSNMSDRQIDALIEQYTKELETAQVAHQALPYNPKPSQITGTLVNLVA